MLYIWAVLYTLAHALNKLELSTEDEDAVDDVLKHDVGTNERKFVLHLDIKDTNSKSLEFICSDVSDNVQSS